VSLPPDCWSSTSQAWRRRADPATLDTKAVAATRPRRNLNTVDFLMNIIPTTVVDAFAKSEILDLFFSSAVGTALLHFGEKGAALLAS
jgi:aerobic C4-dicarboxylate transport protein